MASTYSTNLGLELQATGENSATWGTKTNTNLELLEDAISDVGAITHDDSANYTLTDNDGSTDQSRSMVLEIGGALTAARNLVVPTNDKLYVVKNGTSGGYAVTVKTSGGTGISIASGRKELVYCDGTNVESAIDKLGGLTATVTELNLLDGITAIKDEDDMASDSATSLSTQQSIKAYVDAQVTAQDLDFQGDSGGALSIDLDSETLDIAGGTGIDTSGATNTLTVAIDSTVATLTGSQTLTNKTITSPTINTPTITGNTTFSDGAYDFDIASHDTSNGLKLGGTLVTSTAAELNQLDGFVINTTATSNLGLGTGAVDSITTGDYNVGVGDNALTACTEGIRNTATGHSSLQSNTTGNNNTASGQYSLPYNTTGSSNTASGMYSLQSNTTGASNTANGRDSLYANTTGGSNTASGYRSL